MKKLALTFCILFSTSVSASKLCVGNFSQQSITWNLKNSQDVVIDSELAQGASTRWRCSSLLSEQDDATVIISLSQGKYHKTSCSVEVQANDWILVNASSEGLECRGTNKEAVERRTNYGPLQELEDVSLVVRADYNGTIPGSQLQLINSQGDVLATSQEDTFGTGVYQIPLKAIDLSGPLFLEITDENSPIKVSGILPENFDFDQDVMEINLATTLVTELMKEGKDQERAGRMVQKFLRLEEAGWSNHSLKIPATLYQKSLNEILDDVKDNRRPEISVAAFDPKDILDPAKSIAIDQGKKYITDYFGKLAKNGIGGPAGDIARAGAGSILNLIFPFGGKDRTKEQLDEINRKLDEQAKLLQGIQTQIDILGERMNEAIQLMKELLDNQQRNHFEQLNATLMNAVSAINAQYDMMTDIVKAGPSQDQAKFNRLVDSILEPTHTATYLNQIHTMLTADQGFGRPLITLYRELVNKQVNGKGDGPRFYSNDYLVPMNQFYGYYYRAQLKALNLLIEANNALATPDVESSKRLVALFNSNVARQLALTQLPSVNLPDDNLMGDLETKTMWLKKPENFPGWQTPLTWRSFLPDFLPRFAFAGFNDWNLASEEQLSSLFGKDIPAGENNLVYLSKKGFEFPDRNSLTFILGQDNCVFEMDKANKICWDYQKNDLALPLLARPWEQNTPP